MSVMINLRFLQALVQQVVGDGKILMRADGPYGQPNGEAWQGFKTLVIIAGGIGHPLLSLWTSQLARLLI